MAARETSHRTHRTYRISGEIPRMSPPRTDTGLDRTARDAVDRHWAVAALDEALRLRARAAADRAWERVAHPSRVAARALTRSEQQDVEVVAQAYERAALERAEALLRNGTADPERARLELRIAADETFALVRVIPGAAGLDPDGLYQALRVASMAVVADRAPELALWLRAHPLAIDEGLAALPWDARLRRELTQVWLDLLEGSGDAVERAFDRLGALRELRPEREALLLGSLALADAQQMRLHLVALYAMAEAAAALVLHLRRGPSQQTRATLARHFDTVRSATIGDSALDRVVPWLQLAAEGVALRQSVQIPLPGLLA